MIETKQNSQKVAIVYDRVNKFGGAERVLLTLHEMFPDAPLYTSVYNERTASWAQDFKKIYTSFLQNIPFAKKHNELFGWLMPIAFEGNFSSKGRPASGWKDYDLVISVTSEAAKGIITNTNTKHVCYMLTPTRYLWSGYDEYFKNLILRFISRPIVSYLRWWDKVAATRPDKIIAISTVVQKRINKYYNRDSEIIFPPVDLPVHSSRFTVHKDYYLYVGRLVKYKKVDLLVDTFNDLELPLVIVGTGPEAYSLKHVAYSNISFLGQISDSKLSEIYSKAKAFLMPQEEDFGITSVEAQSFGVPVIAYNKGGSLDTVVDGKTGILFNDQTKQSLINAIARFDRTSFNGGYLITNAKRFSKDIFKNKLSKLINNL